MLRMIQVMSRTRAEHDDLPPGKSVIVSITDPRRPARPVVGLDTTALLRVEFRDCAPTPDDPQPAGLATAKQVAVMADFLKATIPGADVLRVHCDGGASRSAAVAVAVADWLDIHGGIPPIASGNSRFCPNPWVYRLAAERLGVDPVRVANVLQRVAHVHGISDDRAECWLDHDRISELPGVELPPGAVLLDTRAKIVREHWEMENNAAVYMFDVLRGDWYVFSVSAGGHRATLVASMDGDIEHVIGERGASVPAGSPLWALAEDVARRIVV